MPSVSPALCALYGKTPLKGSFSGDNLRKNARNRVPAFAPVVKNYVLPDYSGFHCYI